MVHDRVAGSGRELVAVVERRVYKWSDRWRVVRWVEWRVVTGCSIR